MALVIPGTELRNKLLARFPEAIQFLEAGSFKPWLDKAFRTKDIQKGPQKGDTDYLDLGDITYQSTQMQIGASRYRAAGRNGRKEHPDLYEINHVSLGTTTVSIVQQALTDPESIPKLLLHKELNKIPDYQSRGFNPWLTGQDLVKVILQGMLSQ